MLLWTVCVTVSFSGVFDRECWLARSLVISPGGSSELAFPFSACPIFMERCMEPPDPARSFFSFIADCDELIEAL